MLRFLPELPLLRRELTESAQRPRTYISRVVVAAILLGLVLLIFEQQAASWAAQFNRIGGGFGMNSWMGLGGAVFREVAPVLFISILVLMPAFCSSAVTQEKERNTLGSLFLTRLSPTAILLEKLLSRMTPMTVVLLLSFPLMAYIYSFGGVDTLILTQTLFLLLVQMLFVATLSLACSSWSCTNVGAFITSYILLFFIILAAFIFPDVALLPQHVWMELESGTHTAEFWSFFSGFRSLLTAAFGDFPGLFNIIYALVPALTACGLPLFACVCFFAFARMVLIYRADATPKPGLLRVFRLVDRLFVAANNRFAGGREIIRDSDSYPTDDPVEWRERTRKSLGKFRYLLRILVVLEAPTFLLAVYSMVDPNGLFSTQTLRGLLMLLWSLAAVVTVAKGATLFSSERARETLEALLSTSLTGKELLLQKIRGMNRLLLVLSIPIMTVHLSEAAVFLQTNGNLVFSVGAALGYGLLVTATTFVLLKLLAWIAMYMGLLFRSQMRAILVTFFTFGTWIIIPPAFGEFLYSQVMTSFASRGYYYGQSGNDPGLLLTQLVTWVSPASLIFSNASVLLEISPVSGIGGGYRGYGYPIPAAFSSFLMLCGYSLCLLICRLGVSVTAPYLLGRRDVGIHLGRTPESPAQLRRLRVSPSEI